ncbi:MAG TPA: hypothetical protein VFE18_16330 [Phenylobacterium sp.]|uniref:hypothetical protein n=1 Tax=Phenylobacterium sp. TaxID=1871053 RepID=UPI002D231700|nr:hypothetical protein [Phenylobacterium sp.]HZZ69741.1 hypothetical protein [Phenylobacterium sp.]
MFAPPSPTIADLSAAFQAAYSYEAPFIETLKTTAGSEELAVAPAALTPVGDGRLALVVRETNGMLAHMALGAVSIAYVARPPRAGGPWRRIGLWPQIAFNGETGGDDLTLDVRRDLGARPLLFVSAPTLFTGDSEDDAIVIRLDADHPSPIGRVSLQSSDEDAVDQRLPRHSYRGRIVPAKGAGLFAVRYEGWRAAAGSAMKQPFHGTVAYGLRDGCLAALGPLPAPEITVSYSAPADCGPAKAAP